MRIAFVNPHPLHDWDAATPFERALPGAQSAQAHLAVALAERGHDVHLLSATSRPGRHRGVACHALAETEAVTGQAEAVLVSNNPGVALDLRRRLPRQTVVIAWEHNYWAAVPGHQASLRALAAEGGFVLCVSRWHRLDFVRDGGLDGRRVLVLLNAVAPAFESLFGPDEDVLAARRGAERLAFTSVPYKGLEDALALFGPLRRLRPAARLGVYSSFDFYPQGNVNREDDRWRSVFEACRTTPGVDCAGTVPQAELAGALKGTAVLFYPNRVLETCSIAAMEALAAGCVVVAPPFGALPEVLAGFGELALVAGDSTCDAGDFVRRAADVLERVAAGEPELGDRLRRQVDFARRHYTWGVRAAEAERMLEALACA